MSAAAHKALHSPLRAAARLSLYGVFTLLCIPVQALLLLSGLSWRDSFPHWYHRRCCRLLGFRVNVTGVKRGNGAPPLLVCNHVSYLDIIVLAAVMPCSFVAKAEVARWPFFGLLAKLQRTVFIERRTARAADSSRQIRTRLAKGDRIVLFAEGTSSDGNRVLPFKSSLFAVAQGDEGNPSVTVQPVTIAATDLDGMPMGRGLRPLYAWYGAMTLPDHLWAVAGLGRVGVEVRFHEPIPPRRYKSRKALAKATHEAVANGLSAALSGRARGTEEAASRDAKTTAPIATANTRQRGPAMLS